MVDLSSDRISRAPPYSLTIKLSTRTGLSPSMMCLPRHFRFLSNRKLAGPISLATTGGIIVIFFSCGYLDVSVPRVGLPLGGMAIAGRVAPFGYLRV